MDQKDFRENLELKPVTQEHIDQFNELLSYVFQVTEADIEESGFENKRAFIRSKRPILEVSKVFGWFHENKLISQIAIYPCEVNIHGARYKMGGRDWSWNLSRICEPRIDARSNHRCIG